MATILGVTTFVEGDEGDLMCYWDGRVAFPDRHGPQPKTGEYWEVISVASNPKGTVYFLKLGEMRDDLKMVTLQSFNSGETKELYIDGDPVDGEFPGCWNVYSVWGWLADQLPKIHSGVYKSFRQGFFSDDAPILRVIQATEALKVAKESRNREAFEEALGIMVREGALEFRHAREELEGFLYDLPGGLGEHRAKDKEYVKKIFLPALVEELQKHPDFDSVFISSLDNNLMLFPKDEVKGEYDDWRIEFSVTAFSPWWGTTFSWGKGFDYRDGVEAVARQVIEASKSPKG